MIYPVVVKKIAGERYAAYCLITDSIFAVAATMPAVLDDVRGQFAFRVHDRDALIDVIVLSDDAAATSLAASAPGKWV